MTQMEIMTRNNQDNLEIFRDFSNSPWKVRRGEISSVYQFHENYLATKSEDPTQPSQFNQLSAEDRKFLEEALKSMTVDVIEELNIAMRTLMKDGESSEDEQVQALEVVTSFVADMDTANDFCKIGGFSILLPCLNSKYSEVRSETALLIGEFRIFVQYLIG